MSTDLWAVHIEGPDDLYAAPNREEAKKGADNFNAWWANHTAGQERSDLAPRVHAAAIPWPWTPEAHAEDLPEWADFFVIRDLS